MKIAVVGTGYVGLVARRVSGRERQRRHLCRQGRGEGRDAATRARCPIYEPGLEELVKRNTAEGRLTFTTELPKAVAAAEIVFIAVGTPQGEDGSADLQHVLGVARDDRPGDERLQGHRRQEHGAGRHGREGARGRSAARPRIPSAWSATPSS